MIDRQTDRQTDRQIDRQIGRQIDRYKNFISNKKNIAKNYNCKSKYILHNTITNVNVQKKQERYNNDVINAITNIVFERRQSFNNTYYGTSLV